MNFPNATVVPNFHPDQSAIRAHSRKLFNRCQDEYPDGLLEIRCLVPGKKKPPKAQLFATTEDGIDQATDFAAGLNEQGYNVYVGVNPRKPNTPLHHAASADAVEIAFFQFIDCDSEAAMNSLLDKCKIPYTFAVTTGTTPHQRSHAYWELETPTRNMAAWTAQQDALADHFQSDRVIDPPRIMRLAGTINWPSAKKQQRGYVAELTTIKTEFEDENDR